MRCLLAMIAVSIMAACSNPKTSEQPDVVTVHLTPAGDTLTAEWVLPEAVTAFTFFEDPMPYEQRLADWIPEGDGWTFDGGTIARKDGALFGSFVLNLSPVKAIYDRKYVPVARVGDEGWIVFADALAPLGAAHQVSFDGFPEGSLIYGGGVVSGTADVRDGGALGIFYAGPSSNVHRDGGILIAGPEIPDVIKDDLAVNLDTTIAKLTDAWGYAPDVPPAVIITSDTEWNGQSWKGGVREEVITFHLRGFDLTQNSDSFAASMRNTAMHEAVHLWNGALFDSSENAEQSWVHEGAAEYIANRLWMNEATFSASAQKALNGCILSLGAASIRETEIASRGLTPYQCGHVVHLAAELSAVSQTGGDVLGLWKSVFDSAGDARVYDSNTFIRAAVEAGGEPFQQVMDMFDAGLSHENATRLVASLNDLGAEVTPLTPASETPGDPDLSRAVLMRLLSGVCEGGFGFTFMGDHFRFDTGDRCGDTLAGDPQITTLNGMHLIETPVAAYIAARKACGAGEPIRLGRLDGEVLPPLGCPEPMTNLPALYEVRSAGPLPDL